MDDITSGTMHIYGTTTKELNSFEQQKDKWYWEWRNWRTEKYDQFKDSRNPIPSIINKQLNSFHFWTYRHKDIFLLDRYRSNGGW